ncbi:hypothetical protein NXS19_007236 [Fusarium pseudograminearum]|nr:hypothetical protein NXS19_007236 [Fusarium pseudograminearum]
MQDQHKSLHADLTQSLTSMTRWKKEMKKETPPSRGHTGSAMLKLHVLVDQASWASSSIVEGWGFLDRKRIGNESYRNRV